MDRWGSRARAGRVAACAASGVALLASAARAAPEPRYTLDRGNLVVDMDGVLEDVPVACPNPVGLARQGDRLFVACGADGSLVYSLADPSRPVLAERRDSAPCGHVSEDGSCTDASALRARFPTMASPAAIAAAACALTGSVGGRPLDVVLGVVAEPGGVRRCKPAAPPGAVALLVRTEQAEDARFVVVEMDPPDGVALEDSRVALAAAGRGLRDRLEGRSRAAPFATEAPPEQPATTEKRKWYGWQTIVVDCVAIGALFPFFFPGVALYGLGSPIVHWIHGNVGAGLISATLRLGGGATLVGGGAMASSSGGSAAGAGGAIFIVTGIVALATAPVLDAAVFGYDEPEPEKSVRLVPTFAVTPAGATAGVAGTF